MVATPTGRLLGKISVAPPLSSYLLVGHRDLTHHGRAHRDLDHHAVGGQASKRLLLNEKSFLHESRQGTGDYNQLISLRRLFY